MHIYYLSGFIFLKDVYISAVNSRTHRLKRVRKTILQYFSSFSLPFPLVPFTFSHSMPPMHAQWNSRKEETLGVIPQLMCLWASLLFLSWVRRVESREWNRGWKHIFYSYGRPEVTVQSHAVSGMSMQKELTSPCPCCEKQRKTKNVVSSQCS